MTLFRQLPNTSRVNAVLLGDEYKSRWGDAEHILANIYDAIRVLTQITAYKGTGKRPGSPPTPLPRPGDAPSRKQRDPDADERAREYLELMAPGGPGTAPTMIGPTP